MVLVFVGFMAGYNKLGFSVWMGTIGLVTTTFYTFLFSFLFIFIGAPFIEKSQENKNIKQMLSLVTAAVVGVILYLTIYLSKAVLFPKELSLSNFDYISATWVAISIVALHKFKINMMVWIGISAVFGLMNFLILG